jgi:hypothetical protein
MKYSNQISVTIEKKDLNEILDALNFIDDKLCDLVRLTSEELASLPKMKKHTISFVTENLELAEKNPELVPSDVDLVEIKKDIELVKSIDNILKPIKKLTKKLNDSAVLASSEAYLPSLAIYNAVKAHAIRNKKKDSTIKV